MCGKFPLDARPMPQLYIARARSAHNQGAELAFQNIIEAMKRFLRKASGALQFSLVVSLGISLLLLNPRGVRAGQRHGAVNRGGKSHAARVQTGLDVLEVEKFAPL